LKKSVAIVGHGRFGKTLVRLLKDDFDVAVYSRRAYEATSARGFSFLKNESDIFSRDIIFYAVPIRAFEEVIKRHTPHYRKGQTIIDVLSVKCHPRDVFNKYVKDKNVQILLTHPMFGPDSSKHGFTHLPMIVDKFRTSDATYDFWISYFNSKKLKVIEMTADEHDRQAANSLNLTHFIGRVLQEYGFKPTQIDSLGAKKLKEIMDQVCNDTWELYEDMQKYNPYAKAMIEKLQRSFKSIQNHLA
jgi:prephenate dehydrogenase